MTYFRQNRSLALCGAPLVTVEQHQVRTSQGNYPKLSIFQPPPSRSLKFSSLKRIVHRVMIECFSFSSPVINKKIIWGSSCTFNNNKKPLHQPTWSDLIIWQFAPFTLTVMIAMEQPPWLDCLKPAYLEGQGETLESETHFQIRKICPNFTTFTFSKALLKYTISKEQWIKPTPTFRELDIYLLESAT